MTALEQLEAWEAEAEFWKRDFQKIKAENDRLHREANLNMAEICRLRGQVALLRSKIIKAGRK